MKYPGERGAGCKEFGETAWEEEKGREGVGAREISWG